MPHEDAPIAQSAEEMVAQPQQPEPQSSLDILAASRAALEGTSNALEARTAEKTTPTPPEAVDAFLKKGMSQAIQEGVDPGEAAVLYQQRPAHQQRQVDTPGPARPDAHGNLPDSPFYKPDPNAHE